MVIIKQVNQNKSTGQLTITIPRNKGIKKGDYVKVEKLRIEKVD